MIEAQPPAYSFGFGLYPHKNHLGLGFCCCICGLNRYRNHLLLWKKTRSAYWRFFCNSQRFQVGNVRVFLQFSIYSITKLLNFSYRLSRPPTYARQKNA